ncbi:MAG: response regulator [Phycisphaeraceae bacterium]|nr:response regulator [Phycisphaeraceae bacterium]
MGRKARILIADDDHAILTALKARLEQINAEVITAEDGYSALARAREHRPDLMVLDINMPAGDGFSVHERLDTIEGMSKTPIIYLTGDRSERLDNLAFQMGAYEVFHKPCDMKLLQNSVIRALQPKAA